LISLAFLDGLAVSDERAMAAMPLLPPGRWQSLLAETGFEMVSTQPGPASPFAWIGGHVFVARVPPAPVSDPSSPALWDLLHETLSPDRMPDRVLVRSALPRLEDGSIDTSGLDRAFGAARPATGVEPATDLERSIAAVFATILNQSTISVQENFFDLGADSLTAARACEALQHVVRKRIDVVDLLTHPNIRSLAAHLSTSEVDATSSLAGERARKRLALMASRRRPSREEHQA
jgi:phosphopantetheine binding protein